ncbi:MAG: DUF4350 domain-containing protein [Kaiparowitsia implicata GSE-PSE-MK54-09C]|jgi:hypothetical protein|nr:DUF4350 domain-containing protein [Kaiparowitsia implicata GSE-PSE-MK54-09C]
MTTQPIRQRWFWAIALGALLLLSMFGAPNATPSQHGSTYSRTPAGYGAWYAELQQQGIDVQRWQRPASEFFDETETPRTLVQIFPTLSPVMPPDLDWVAQGNVLVQVGIRSPVTAAPFRSQVESPVGAVRVETRRRYQPDAPPAETLAETPEFASQEARLRLADEAGALVWEVPWQQGQVMYIATPHLAANAYQTEAGNFAFFTDLVTEPGHPLWVDEYLHGYVDADELAETGRDTLLGYLAQTPVALLALQAGILVLLAVWGDRRLGPPHPQPNPKPDTGDAYIRALGAVLHKAERVEFVVALVGQAERRRLQRSLGLGLDPVEDDKLMAAWQQQTGQPAAELAPLRSATVHTAKVQDGKRRGRTDRFLVAWLDQLHRLRRRLS